MLSAFQVSAAPACLLGLVELKMDDKNLCHTGGASQLCMFTSVEPRIVNGLSEAVSVIAVIEISVKTVSLCFQHSVAVKNVKKDIERLQGKVDINDVLGEVKQL